MKKAPETVEALLEELEAEGTVRLCTRYKRPPLPSRLLRALYEEQPGNPLAQGFIARYPLSPSDLLERLGAECREGSVLAVLADNPRTPPNTLSLLARHEDEVVRAAMARNPRLTQRDLQAMIDEDNPCVSAALAENTALKAPQQALLATHRAEAVRLGLTRNPSLDPDIALALSADPCLAVRCQLAAEATAEAELLLFWADCDREEIQLALLERAELPDDVLDSLHLSPHARVRERTAQRRSPGPALMLHLARSKDEAEREEVCRREDLPPGIQHRLCQDESSRVRAALAANPAIHRDLACHLVSDPEPTVCLALLDNPSLDLAVIQEMVRVGDPATMAALVGFADLAPELAVTLVNQRLSAAALLHLAWHGQPMPNLRADLARCLARHELPILRALAARSELLEPALLAWLADDPSSRVAEAARSNRNYRPDYAPEQAGAAGEGDSPEVTRCLAELDRLLYPNFHESN